MTDTSGPTPNKPNTKETDTESARASALSAERPAPFAVALREAVRRRGLPLDRICERLTARGIRLTPATLSYWQRDRTRPERSDSLRAVVALESILDLPPGGLSSLLPPQRPRGRRVARTDEHATRRLYGQESWQEQALGDSFADFNRDIVVLLTREVLHLDRRGCVRRLIVNHVVRAVADGPEQMMNLHFLDDPDGRLPEATVRCGRLESLRQDATSGGVLLRIGFGRPLTLGETVAVDYEIRTAPYDRPTGFHERGIRGNQDAYLLHVYFPHDRHPALCHSYYRENSSAPQRKVRPLPVDTSGTAHLYAAQCRQGIYGMSWQWPDKP
ncbi:hypothetical protein [Streptomyces flavofungini]|uniref:hypothetical protein n=1 Tax=Streptomyces flavofungini TaxID=68200 RepID=UPI0025B1DD9C|nr:hypothetical protein [Streptomyces flavofungini]WJV44842.1 hypothetical protein QUY26_04425 [Streptomyces flavofungini]